MYEATGVWIDVRDELPKVGQKVWVGRNYNNAPVVLATYNGMTKNPFRTATAPMDYFVSPTHWMPAAIPAAPEPFI